MLLHTLFNLHITKILEGYFRHCVSSGFRETFKSLPLFPYTDTYLCFVYTGRTMTKCLFCGEGIIDIHWSTFPRVMIEWCADSSC